MSGKVEQVNTGLSRYYGNMGVKDYDDRFKVWCQECDYDTEAVEDELNTEPTESTIVEFDPEFPLPNRGDYKDEEIPYKIYRVIKHCFLRADAYLNDQKTQNSGQKLYTKDGFRLTQQQTDTGKIIYKDNCPAIYHSGTQDDKDFLTVLTVGRRERVEFLQTLFDLYMRASIKKFHQDEGTLSIHSWADEYPYFKKCDAEAKQMVIHALNSFVSRICPRLLFNSLTRIQDSLEETLKYIWIASQFIKRMVDKEERTMPFQMDFCIAFPKTKTVDSATVKKATNDDDDDDDDDDVPAAVEEKEEKNLEFYDHIGDIYDKLEKNNLKYEKKSVSVGSEDDEKLTRVLQSTWDKYYKTMDTEYLPLGSRFVAFVDRRNTEESDELIVYQLPKQVRTIPRGAVPEWYLNASKTCILPNVGYDPKLAETDDEKKPSEEKEKGKNFNINSLRSCAGSLLTLSFHCKRDDNIKCYLYLNGQICRFFAQDVVDVLPLFFDKEYGRNKAFCDLMEKVNDLTNEEKDEQNARKKMIEEIDSVLKDRELIALRRVWERNYEVDGIPDSVYI